jgi:[phosphatase 2A protein]-leucine-carboxy methyltransferase
MAKVSTIERLPKLVSLIRSKLQNPAEPMISKETGTLLSSYYNIHAMDLRTLTLTPPPSLPNISHDAPTLILSECCLIYLTPNDATSILKALTQRFLPSPTPVALVIYEPIRPNDQFGRTMVSNLATRGIVLETLRTYPSLTSQRLRLAETGFPSGQCAADTDFIFDRWISDAEKERIAKLEMVDELEEWTLLAKHYCVAWGWRDEPGGMGTFGSAWKDIEPWTGDDSDAAGLV